MDLVRVTHGIAESSTTIKEINTNRFEIGLYELPDGQYFVAYVTADKEIVGEPVNDYNLADSLFEIKLQELEAN